MPLLFSFASSFRHSTALDALCFKWSMSQVFMSHVTRMNESCHNVTYEWIMSHRWMSRVKRMNESRQTYEWVASACLVCLFLVLPYGAQPLSFILGLCISWISCHTYECVAFDCLMCLFRSVLNGPQLASFIHHPLYFVNIMTNPHSIYRVPVTSEWVMSHVSMSSLCLFPVPLSFQWIFFSLSVILCHDNASFVILRP